MGRTEKAIIEERHENLDADEMQELQQETGADEQDDETQDVFEGLGREMYNPADNGDY